MNSSDLTEEMNLQPWLEAALEQFINNSSLTEETLSIEAIEETPLSITISTHPQLYDFNRTGSNILRRDIRSTNPAVGLTSDSTFRYVTWSFLSRLTFQVPEAGTWHCKFTAAVKCTGLSGSSYNINIGLNVDDVNYISQAYSFTRVGEIVNLSVTRTAVLKSGSLVLPTYTNKGAPDGHCVLEVTEGQLSFTRQL